MQNSDFKSCVIIGAGPAGMTAALYLNRFHREVTVLDAGSSRARWIPKTHNCPGFPDGLSGDELLERMRLQAENYGTRVTPERAARIQRVDGGFSVSDTRGGQYLGRTVLLATGAKDILPPDPWVSEAVSCGALRLCAICDGFEASDDNIAVYGPLCAVFDHAKFMRTYSAKVTLVQSDNEQVDTKLCQSAEKWGITLMKKPRDLLFDGTRCGFIDANGTRRDFDTIYVMLGSRSQAKLAIELGANVDEEKKLVVNTHQMTSIDGLFAIGDVVSALSQLSVAVGHAAVAATAIHNMLPRNLR